MTDVRGARIVRLLDDPAVTGDLLLVGMALAAGFDFGWDYGSTIAGMAEALWSAKWNTRHIRMVFKDDMRTYQAPMPTRKTCTSPMLRRDGVCGSSATAWGMVTDWATAEQEFVGACRRHWGWYRATTQANREAKPDIVPLPYANHGGALVPHFPRLNWAAFWRRLEPKWTEHPERTARSRPDLELILGDGRSPGSTPLLWVVPMGGAS